MGIKNTTMTDWEIKDTKIKEYGDRREY